MLREAASGSRDGDTPSVSPWSSGPLRSWALRVVVLVIAGVVLVGCSYAREEPGLFGRTPAARSGPPPSPDEPPPVPATNPALPVLAEEVWTSADGLGVQVRIGVHAVRRISGATVLDWSVTPLKAPNLRVGDAVPPTLDLGLSRPADELPRIYLLDSRGDHLYRPLVSAAGAPRCVCTPLSLAQRRLRVGHTTLLQVAFPALPTSSSTIDVAMATVPPFWQVPVTPADHIPVAVGPTELGRPAELSRPGDTAAIFGGFSDMFGYGPGRQIFRVQPNRVLASSTFTTLEWTIWSVTGGAGLDSASSPPFAEPEAAGVDSADPVTASGPVLVVATERGERTLRTRLVRSDVAGPGAVECLCSPLRAWTSVLRRPDKPVTVVTTYPPLPAAAQRAQVRFGALGVISMPVTSASDVRSRAGGERPWSRTTWRPGDLRSEPGWTSRSWPTPVPSADQLPDLAAAPYALVR